MRLDFYEVYKVTEIGQDGEEDIFIGFGFVEATDLPPQISYGVKYLIPRESEYWGKPYRISFGQPVSEEHRLVLKNLELETIIEPLNYEEWLAKYATDDEKESALTREDMVQLLQLQSRDFEAWEQRYQQTQGA